MCEQCVKAKAELFPDATKDEFHEILWNHTGHPFDGYPRIREQLEEYARDLKTLADYGYSGDD